eukprot:CAMPEP_0170542992 /NCGR_PEP_ID=MMETSP0211-20121228/2257_1 /TAXON_ID=311385 /ORGANISM="Pseudokeronopsis sp., Strain OXSARD2" /LENGTH=116 /DNA_ID=CAMNT_0010846243 /DNA_START=328 /DNA_END=678 /DNA_ORIENTATION=-
MTLIYFHLILAQKTVATALDNGTDLEAMKIVDFGSGPTVGKETEDRAGLAPANLPLHLEGVSPMLWGDLCFVFPTRRATHFLTKTVFVLFYVAYFLSIFPDDVLVRTGEESDRRRQ